MSRPAGTGTLAPVREDYIRELMAQKGVNTATVGRYIGYTRRRVQACLKSGLMTPRMIRGMARYFRVSEEEIRGAE